MRHPRTARLVGIVCAMAMLSAACGSDVVDGADGVVADDANGEDTTTGDGSDGGNGSDGGDGGDDGVDSEDATDEIDLNCADDQAPVPGQPYTAIAEIGLNTRSTPEGLADGSNVVGDGFPLGAQAIATGRCTETDRVWWEVESADAPLWVAAEFLEFPLWDFNGEEEDKADLDLVALEDPDAAAPVLCDESPELLVVEPTQLEDGVPVFEATYENSNGQEFVVSVEGFVAADDDIDRAVETARSFFDSGICLELVPSEGPPEDDPVDNLTADDVVAELRNQLADAGLDPSDEEIDALRAALTSAGASEAELRPPDPTRVITIEAISEGAAEGAEFFTGHFIVDPRLPYNGRDVYSVKESQTVRARGKSKRGTLVLYIITSDLELQASGSTGPKNWTGLLKARADSSGSFLWADAFRSIVVYVLRGTWRAESLSKE